MTDCPSVQVKSSQVKFYCDIRLAFMKKDHQLVYRYNRYDTENYKLKLKKKNLQQVAKKICLKFKIEIYSQD